MNSIITFIVPSINRESLKSTINSLVSQTSKNWKCIVVYDGVNGPSFEDDRVTCVNIEKTGLVGPNNGQSGLVRNQGIKLVQTEWIGFLDDDDTIHPKYVETLERKYSKMDFVVWRMKYQNGMVLPELTNNNLIFQHVGISFCYKNKFENLFFDVNRDGEDFDFVKKLESLSKNFIIAPEIYYNVRH
jgi:glycosyltransferase involved in cell wall biosynthesis